MAAPPGDMRVERSAHYPRARRRMVAYLPPRRPGAGERLRYQILGQLPISNADEHDPQAVILGGRVELAELSSMLLHAPITQLPVDSFTACPQKLSAVAS